MVRAKYSPKHSGSRHRRKKHRPSSSDGSPKTSWPSSRPSSPRGHSRNSSIDSLRSRDSSYDRLIRPSKYSDMSHHRPPHYDRMVCEALARLKSRKGSSTKDIAKSLKHKYPDARKLGSRTIEKVIATAKKLVREGKLVKDGSNYRLSKTSARDASHDDYSDILDRLYERRHSGGHNSSSRRRGRSLSRGKPRQTSRSRGSSRSRSRSTKRRTQSQRKKKKRKTRAIRGAQSRKSIKRGAKRKKKGARKGRTKLATGKRGLRQKKLARARRRVKHSQNARRPKSDKLPEGESSQNKGWFGGWFGGKSGGGGGDSKAGKQNEKGSSSKSEKRSKSTQRAITGGEPENGAV